ncbi:response regulator [Tianweitania sediminis]|nr:response regulator [Tianweitania sediminis]
MKKRQTPADGRKPMDAAILLLVEDEEALHPVFEDALEDAGYGVIVATNGSDAIEALEEDVGRFKGIVTDIKLGAGPNGWDIAHRARVLAPAIPIVYMSGDSVVDWTAHGVPNSIILQKPFALAQLITAISQLINQAQSSPGVS